MFDSSPGVHEVDARVSEEMPFSTLMLERWLDVKRSNEVPGTWARAQKVLTSHSMFPQ
jgi:hypothetical protein